MGFLGNIFYEMLYGIYSIVNNYAAAIIIFTLIVKILTVPLDFKQRKQSYMLRKLQPELDSLKKRYGHDMKKYQIKVQEVQKEAGYSPLGGCLPILIILPIFYGLYSAVQIMQKEQVAQLLVAISNGVSDPNQLFVSFGWIRNIWAPDSMIVTALPSMADVQGILSFTGTSHMSTTVLEQAKQIATTLNGNEASLQQFLYNVGTLPTWGIGGALTLAKASNGLFILPIIGGLAAFFSQKISMKSMPVTEGQMASTMKMMLWMMPLITIFIGATSPAAFSFYWITNMIASFFEQLIFTAYFAEKDKKEKELQETKADPTIGGNK